MNIVIRIAERDRAKAWGLLVRHSAGTALPDRTFIILEEAVRMLRRRGIDFTEISRVDGRSGRKGALAGERI